MADVSIGELVTFDDEDPANGFIGMVVEPTDAELAEVEKRNSESPDAPIGPSEGDVLVAWPDEDHGINRTWEETHYLVKVERN